MNNPTLLKKITEGYVIQYFDPIEGFLSQEFVAYESTWEHAAFNIPLTQEEQELAEKSYLPFNMTQPNGCDGFN